MRLIMLHFVRKHFCLDNSLNNLEHKTFNSLPPGLLASFLSSVHLAIEILPSI